ncbi:chromate transporter [Halomonas sp. MCCC 1A11036]|uniref:Chromate transporter n=1 Tax=Billgrantia zhangzhouensis TaxID=2733481 RepID=A0ABS9AGI3_9GAMM|nr:chromate transporter [Halomonas zhangzhouensis]MCE8020837.1 chromate transporter [Halomonas zhangzhouensis]
MTTSQQGKLFFSFLRINLLGFDGGPSAMHLVHQKAVKRHAWLKNEVFSNVLRRLAAGLEDNDRSPMESHPSRQERPMRQPPR